MNKNALKRELIQKVIACYDIALLKQIEELLLEVNAKELGEDYEAKTSNSAVPDRIYAELERGFKAYQKGEIKTESFQDYL